MVTLHEERVDHIDGTIRRNRRIAMDLREQYIMLSGIDDVESLEPKMRLPYFWRRSLSWYHRQVAKSLGNLCYSDALRKFWEAELEMRNSEYERFPEDVIYERMEFRRKANLYACYQKIHRILRLADYEIYPIQVEPHVVSYRITAWFDQEQPSMTDVIISIVDGNFLIRQGLAFTKSPGFLQGRGFKEQEYMANRAFERYQDLCENLMWEMDQARNQFAGTTATNECIEIVHRYREMWDEFMDTWTQGQGNINESLLAEDHNGVPIPRRFEEIWEEMIENRWHPMNHIPQSEDEGSASEEESEHESQEQEELSDRGSTVED